MKSTLTGCAAVLFCCACGQQTPGKRDNLAIRGTWELVSGTITETGKKTAANYPKDFRMIKIINDSHFSFLKHSLDPKQTKGFDAGGGSYSLSGNTYTEHLDFYADKNWEGKTFKFTLRLSGDSLIQTGVEKVEQAGVDRTIVEKYIKIK